MIKVIGPRDPRGPDVIDTTSRSTNWSQGLSPFYLGPIPLYEGAVVPEARRMENAWQYAKVYTEHVSPTLEPNAAYYEWARAGWESERAHRYPMGRGAAPEFSWWAGKRLDYIQARKRIYIPLYAKAVVKTEAFQKLLELYLERGDVTLWDFDGYDHRAQGMSLLDVVNNPRRPMGHAFVLAHLLERHAEKLIRGDKESAPSGS